MFGFRQMPATRENAFSNRKADHPPITGINMFFINRIESMRFPDRGLALLAALLVATASACFGEQKPPNIIFIIGDGMGIGAITAARCMGPGEYGGLTLDTMPVTGFVKTHSENALVTDSAASGTALATGHKTQNGRLSTDAQGRRLLTIAELASETGKSTGIITTDLLTGATPAAFFSHCDSRAEQESIALQLPATPVTVAMGGGKEYFLPAVEGRGGRKDAEDVVAMAKSKGFEVCFDSASLAAVKPRRLLGLFTFDAAGPTLEAMLASTLAVVSANPRGFFIMAESCLPDKGGHANNLDTSFRGVSALDDALRCALVFAKKDGNTLVVVTADHETGGLAVQSQDDKNPKLKPGWLSGDHTGNMVPVYAFGPGAEFFSGTHDNTELPKIMAGLWGKKLGD